MPCGYLLNEGMEDLQKGTNEAMLWSRMVSSLTPNSHTEILPPSEMVLGEAIGRQSDEITRVEPLGRTYKKRHQSLFSLYHEDTVRRTIYEPGRGLIKT